jgi:adenylate cyclase class 2
MAREIEIKLRVQNISRLREQLRRMGARPAHGNSSRVHEWNVVFDTPRNSLARRKQLLRIRTETPQPSSRTLRRRRETRSTLTFKRPPENSRRQNPASRRHKVFDEIETSLNDAGEMARILAALGFHAGFCYEKYRTSLRLPPRHLWARQLKLELDETPIGSFIELEGPPRAIDRAARELGRSRRDYIVKNYHVLYLEECRRLGQQPRDMLFAR